MPAPGDRRSARGAIDDFTRHLANRRFASTTQRIRRHFLDEYLQHVQDAVGTTDISVGEFMDPARAGAWLSDAAAGKTRSRNTLHGPDAAAYSNSMRVRIDSYNAFAEFLHLPDRHDRQAPASGYYLTPADTTWPSAGPSMPTPRHHCAPLPLPHSSPTPTGPSRNSPG
jgi:hypothetical protein